MDRQPGRTFAPARFCIFLPLRGRPLGVAVSQASSTRQYLKGVIVSILKKMTCCFGGLLMITVLAAGHAYSAEKIGVIDLRKAILTSSAGQKAKEVMDQKAKSLQADLKKDQDALIALQKEMEKKGSAWNDAMKKEKAAEFQKKGREFNAKQQEASATMRKLEEEHLKPLQQKALEVAKKVAKDEGYSMVLPREVLVVAPEDADISDKVVSELNKAMK